MQLQKHMAQRHMPATFFEYIDTHFSVEELSYFCAQFDMAALQAQDKVAEKTALLETFVQDILTQMHTSSEASEEQARASAEESLLTSLT